MIPHPWTRRTWAVALLALASGCDPSAPVSFLLGDSAASAPAESFSRQATVPPDYTALRDRFVSAINAERAKVGLKPLVMNEMLNGMADAYATRLIQGDFFGHTDPANGATIKRRAAMAGYVYFRIGENLAGGHRTIEEAMAALMESPSHRANILDPDFIEVGVSIRDGGRHGRYWVQEFGRPLGQ